jgi:hypothetical protein
MTAYGIPGALKREIEEHLRLFEAPRPGGPVTIEQTDEAAVGIDAVVDVSSAAIALVELQRQAATRPLSSQESDALHAAAESIENATLRALRAAYRSNQLNLDRKVIQ